MRVSTQWDKPSSKHSSLEILKELALDHALAGGMVGRQIASLIHENNYHALCTFELSYHEMSVMDALECRQALAFFSKLSWLDLGVDLEDVAWEKFKLSESACRETNRIFRLFGGENKSFSFTPADVLVLYKARRKIKQILGPVPSWDMLRYRFGPGSTTSVRRMKSCPMYKMSGPITCSYNLFRAEELQTLLREIPHWTSQHSDWALCPDGEGEWLVERVNLEITPGALEFVPKNALSRRAIVKPATLNGFFQMGIGDYMARRLKRAGIDIADQSLNQRLAREGSLTGVLATLDLSSASDTIATELVRFLLPSGWFRILDILREDSIVYQGEEMILEKFSSMGNGFTFPLETLIFWALTWATCKGGPVNAYGDDIICPADEAVQVMRTLTLCGFSVNQKKSYWSGAFRESCGKDYFHGIDIRPFYQKDLVSAATLFVLHNFYVRSFQVDRAKAVRRMIPGSLKIFGPDGFGDGHLLGDWQPEVKQRVARKGYGGVFFDTFVRSSRSIPSVYPGDHISPLYHIYVSGEPGCQYLRQLGLREPILRFDKSGRPLWGLPGEDGYRRVSIYTLAR